MDAELNDTQLIHKKKGKSRMMNKIQAKELYEKMLANYPDVLTVEDATKLLGFKSQTAVIRRVHQHRIRSLKVRRSFMIPKEYLIDYLLDS
ncbi:MAG: helix-turn-helix domain-containing protein [Christensenellales bacterium]